MNSSISEKFLKKYISDYGYNSSQKKKKSFYISKNPNITVSLSKLFPKFNWNYNELLIHMKISANQIDELRYVIPSKISNKRFFK